MLPFKASWRSTSRQKRAGLKHIGGNEQLCSLYLTSCSHSSVCSFTTTTRWPFKTRTQALTLHICLYIYIYTYICIKDTYVWYALVVPAAQFTWLSAATLWREAALRRSDLIHHAQQQRWRMGWRSYTKMWGFCRCVTKWKRSVCNNKNNLQHRNDELGMTLFRNSVTVS